jgi:hypothetical protein
MRGDQNSSTVRPADSERGWSSRVSNLCMRGMWPIGITHPFSRSGLYPDNIFIFSDCTANNIMLDPSWMYPNGFHPVRIDRKRNFKGKATAYTRTQRPPRYVLIDFGLSRQYTSRDVVDDPLRRGDMSAPEHQLRRPSNPFYTDIYYIGNLVRKEFMTVRAQNSGSSILTSPFLP